MISSAVSLTGDNVAFARENRVFGEVILINRP